MPMLSLGTIPSASFAFSLFESAETSSVRVKKEKNRQYIACHSYIQFSKQYIKRILPVDSLNEFQACLAYKETIVLYNRHEATSSVSYVYLPIHV